MSELPVLIWGQAGKGCLYGTLFYIALFKITVLKNQKKEKPDDEK
jgi:hypothetical protein